MMTLDWETQLRVHHGELTPAEAFALQAERETKAITTIHVSPLPVTATRAIALVPKVIIQNPIGQALVAASATHGIRLELLECYERYRENLGTSANVITWGMKLRQDQYTEGGRNVLFIENGLLCQRHGCYMDSRGYFADSSLVAGREWERQPDDVELEDLADHLKYEFGWESGATCNNVGPIMVALQTPNDAPLQHYCPRPPGDGNQYVIDCATTYLPFGVPIILRPHPKHDFNEIHYRIPDAWTIDRAGDVHSRLRQCRSLVTANSTLGIEALGLGMPVACLGRHVYTGSGAVLECSQHPERLRDLNAWKPPSTRLVALLCAIMRRQMSYKASQLAIEQSPQFQVWADRAKTAKVFRQSETATPYAAAAMRIRCRRDAMLWSLVDSTDTELSRCKPCARERHLSRVVSADHVANGGTAIICPSMIDRLAVAGLDVIRPDLTGYIDRLEEAQKECHVRLPLPEGRIPLGFLYGAHLGDTICTTALAFALRAAGRDVTVVRHSTSLVAYAELAVGFRNDGIMRLNPPASVGLGHVIQLMQRWFGVAEEPYPRPTLTLSDAEIAWATEYTAQMRRPLILVSTGALSNADGYKTLPWAAWGSALSEYGTVLQCIAAESDPRIPSATIVAGLNARQWFALFGQAQMYFGTWAAGIHVAAAFGLEALVVTCPPIDPRALVFPLPGHHVITFLYPQHAYGVLRK
jgi:hypothetical protein